MNILIITYNYLPMNSPRSFRWSSIAEFWTEQGHCVDVVCAMKPGLSERGIINKVNIYRTGGCLLENLRSSISNVRKNDKQSVAKRELGINISIKGVTKRVLKFVHDYTWKKLYWPDFACLWYFSGKKMAKVLHEKNRYDCFISVSHPFTSHLIGLQLKKMFSTIRWIVDIGDPFCFLVESKINNHTLYNKINYKYENEVFKHCDSIAVTTTTTLDRYVDIFVSYAEKMIVIPPMLSLKYGDNSTEKYFKRQHKIKLVYIGTLYRNIRSPEYLLKLYKELLNFDIGNKFELHIIGNIHDCISFFERENDLFGSKLFLHGQIGRVEVVQAMTEADVLINIGNSTVYQLPSKVVEYASTGKPILNIVKSENDSSIAFFESYPAIFTLLEDEREISDRIVNAVIAFIKNPISINDHLLNGWLAPYQVKAIAANYMRLVQK